ncbi:MAG: hypothetical protein V3T86_12765 [Planctomycetota bacterium]
MRIWILACTAAVLLAIIATGFVPFMGSFTGASHPAAYVPDDALLIFHARSINGIRDAFLGIGTQNADPARELIGKPINVPQLDGVDPRAAVIQFVGPDLQQHWLAPVFDKGAFEDAFETERQNLKLRDPSYVARGAYAHLSASRDTPRSSSDHPAVHALAEYPVGTYLRLRDPGVIKKFLGYPFLPGFGADLPTPVLRVLLENLQDLLVAQADQAPAQTRAALILDAKLKPGLLMRAAAVAKRVDPAGLVRALPGTSQIFFAAALDDAGWNSLGLLGIGDAAIAFAVVRTIDTKRPYALAVAVRPAPGGSSAQALHDRLLPEDQTTVDENGAPVRVRDLVTPPTQILHILRKRSRTSDAPGIKLAGAVTNGTLLICVGARAVPVLRQAIAGVSGQAGNSAAASQQVGRHGGMLKSGHVAVGLVTHTAMKWLGDGMPKFLPQSIGQPGALTFTLDVDAANGRARADLRLSR